MSLRVSGVFRLIFLQKWKNKKAIGCSLAVALFTLFILLQACGSNNLSDRQVIEAENPLASFVIGKWEIHPNELDFEQTVLLSTIQLEFLDSTQMVYGGGSVWSSFDSIQYSYEINSDNVLAISSERSIFQWKIDRDGEYLLVNFKNDCPDKSADAKFVKFKRIWPINWALLTLGGFVVLVISTPFFVKVSKIRFSPLSTSNLQAQFVQTEKKQYNLIVRLSVFLLTLILGIFLSPIVRQLIPVDLIYQPWRTLLTLEMCMLLVLVINWQIGVPFQSNRLFSYPQFELTPKYIGGTLILSILFLQMISITIAGVFWVFYIR